MAPGEINRFIARFGLAQLVDLKAESLKYLKLTEAELLARVERDPKLLRLPLVRSGKPLSTGQDEVTWRIMGAELAPVKSSTTHH